MAVRPLLAKPKTRAQLGRIAEDHAARYLQSRGYRIRERNFRTRGGEVDIIAEQGGTLAFVEVRARSSSDFMSPMESVTPAKQRRIARAAARFISACERRERVMRFDVIEVQTTPEGRVRKVELTRGAFQSPSR
jgi:putative endonuclease